MKNKKKVYLLLLILGFILIIIFLKYSPEINLEHQTKIYLNEENNYSFLTLKREGTSGPGTGKLIGDNMEFAFGKCDKLNKTAIWKKKSPGCSSEILNKEICVREIENPQKNYTIYFISWTIGNGIEKKCEGNCESTLNQTAFLKY